MQHFNYANADAADLCLEGKKEENTRNTVKNLYSVCIAIIFYLYKNYIYTFFHRNKFVFFFLQFHTT